MVHGIFDMIFSIKVQRSYIDEIVSMAEDKFKESFKFFKKLSIQDLRTRIIDLRDFNRFADEVNVLEASSESVNPSVISEATSLGLKPPQQWNVYELKSVPGLLVIPNPFLLCGQHHWVRRCLIDYPLKPNVCNLDAHMTRPGNGRLWPHPQPRKSIPEFSTHSEDQSKTDSRLKSSDEGLSSLGGGNSLESSHKRQDSFSSAHEHSVPLAVHKDTQVPAAKKLKLSKPPRHSLPSWLSKESPLYKLRWVTLGYHYNWSSKEYSPDNMSTFPDELGHLSSLILKIVGFPDFRAEAGIVNYYHMDSTLSGHTDHSEKDLSQPLLSISLGQSAVFLIGGQTKETTPLPFLLNSGDIVIMSRESRLAYHGIPRVLSPSPDITVPECLSAESLLHCTCWKADQVTSNSSETDSVKTGNLGGEIDKKTETCCEETDCVCSIGHALRVSPELDAAKCTHSSTICCCECRQLMDTWDTFIDYLSVSRINLNVRQVVSDNFKFGT